MADENVHQSPAQFVAQWLQENQFRAVGYIGELPTDSLNVQKDLQFYDCNHQPYHQDAQHPKLNALIVSGLLESSAKSKAIQQLAYYRNQLIDAVLVFVHLPDTQDWRLSDFFSLGFQHLAHFPHPEHPMEAFEYSLRTYNHKRLWNTPQYWANPQNFGKYWW